MKRKAEGAELCAAPRLVARQIADSAAFEVLMMSGRDSCKPEIYEVAQNTEDLHAYDLASYIMQQYQRRFSVTHCRPDFSRLIGAGHQSDDFTYQAALSSGID